MATVLYFETVTMYNTHDLITGDSNAIHGASMLLLLLLQPVLMPSVPYPVFLVFFFSVFGSYLIWCMSLLFMFCFLFFKKKRRDSRSFERQPFCKTSRFASKSYSILSFDQFHMLTDYQYHIYIDWHPAGMLQRCLTSNQIQKQFMVNIHQSFQPIKMFL